MDKKLTISVDAKISPALQELNKTLDEVAARGDKTAKAFKNVGGGPEFKEGGLAQVLLKQKKLFEDLGESGKKLAKILNEEVAKAQSVLTKQLGTSTQNLEALVKKYENTQERVERLKRRGVDPARIQLAEAYSQRARQQMIMGVADVSRVQGQLGALGDLGEAPPGPEPTPKDEGGRFSRILLSAAIGKAGIPGLGALSGAGAAGMSAAAASAGAVIGANLALKSMSRPFESMAAVGAVTARELQVATSFDATTLIGAGSLAKRPEAARDIDIKEVGAKIAFAIKNYTVQGIFGGDWSGAGRSWERDVRAWREGAILNRQAEIGQSVAALGDVAQYQMARAPYIFNMERRFGAGAYRAASDLGWRMRIEPDELRSYYAPLAQYVGANQAVSYMPQVAAAQLEGMDPQQALSIIGRTAVSGVSPLRYTEGMDPTIRGILGEAVAETMGPRTMMYGGAGAGLANALAGAVTSEGAIGVRQAQQAVLGMQEYGRVMGGHDPFQKSYNIAAATAALGPGASPYTRNFLATQLADPKVLADVIRGNIPESFTYMGISRKAALTAVKDIDRGLIASRWYDTGEDTPAARRMREMKAAGGPMAWAETLRGRPDREAAIREAAPLFAGAQIGLTGGDVGAAEGMLRAAMGLTAPRTRVMREAGAEGVPSAETAALEKVYQSKLKLFNETMDNFNFSVKDGTGAIVDMTKAFDEMSEGMDVMRQKVGIPVAPRPMTPKVTPKK